MKIETVVSERYAEGAQCREESLCCPVSYDARLLQKLPAEILERDYRIDGVRPYNFVVGVRPYNFRIDGVRPYIALG